MMELDKEPVTVVRYPYVKTSVWAGTPNEPALEGAVNSVLTGVTSTHIADTLYTTNLASFKKAKDAGIPAKKFIDASGITAYEIHFSFGPDNNGIGGMLDDSYLTNCLNAQLITPVSENDFKGNQDLKTNKVNSNLDFLKIFTRKIYLYPLFICKNSAELESADIKRFDSAIHRALGDYVKSERNDQSRSVYFKAVDNALTELQSSRDPNYLDAQRRMTKNQFLFWFNQNIGTIGLEPKTKIETKLISENDSINGMKGFVEERYVNEMVRIKRSIDGKPNPITKLLYSYNFVLFNCSHAVKSLHVNSANDERIRDKLSHTIGWNDLKKVVKSINENGFFSDKTSFAMAGVIIGVLELVGLRAVETPVNFVFNLTDANKVSDSLNQISRQKLESQIGPKVVNDPRLSKLSQKAAPELKPRLPHSHLTLKMNYFGSSLKNLVKRAEKFKVKMQVLFDANTNKPSAVVFYNGQNKNVPIATVDLNPNNSNTISIQFGDLPLDQHQIVALLNLLKNDVKLNKGSKESMIFTIGLSDTSAVPDARTLQGDIQEVFGVDASIRIKTTEESPVPKNTGLRN